MKLDGKLTQSEFGDLVGISQPAVSDLLSRGVISSDNTGKEWLLAYCLHLRNEAAGRANFGLAVERAQLARAQRERVEMANEVTRKNLAPVALLETALARVGRQIIGIFDAIPVNLKRRFAVDSKEYEFVTAELAKARNYAAAIKLEDLDLDEKEILEESEDV